MTGNQSDVTILIPSQAFIAVRLDTTGRLDRNLQDGQEEKRQEVGSVTRCW